MGSNTREVVFGLAGITILAVAVWVMFNQADPSQGSEAASQPTQVADAADQLPTRITLPSGVDSETLPSPSPIAAPTPTNTPIPDFHVVAESETLTTIGAIYGVAPDDIAAKNDISDPNKILVGQRLLLPVPGEDLPDRQTGQIDAQTYIVQEGDTLFGLSQEFGVSIEALMETNNIVDQNKLFEGLHLTSPEQVVPQP